MCTTCQYLTSSPNHRPSTLEILTAYFFRLHNLATGKHILSLSYTAQQIDWAIPDFHKELLTSWIHHSNYRSRIYPPVKLPDILQGPLFQNLLLHNPGFTFQWTEWNNKSCWPMLCGHSRLFAYSCYSRVMKDKYTQNTSKNQTRISRYSEQFPSTMDKNYTRTRDMPNCHSTTLLCHKNRQCVWETFTVTLMQDKRFLRTRTR